jgi:hypothetical protein
MHKSHEEFLRQLDIGRQTEKMVALLPKLQAFYLIPNTDLANRLLAAGGAPRAFRMQIIDGYKPTTETIVLPDFEAIGGGQRQGLEVKSKTDFTRLRSGVWLVGNDGKQWNGNCGSDWQGIDLVDYWNYRNSEDQTGSKLILAFVEESTGEILARSLQHLTPRPWVPKPNDPNDYSKHRHGIAGMVYFHRDELRCFHQGDANDLPLFKAHPEVLLAPTVTPADNLSEL